MACKRSSEARGPPTSEIRFSSSLHGRKRRLLRKIDRRDLQAAVKHGKKEPGLPHPLTGAPRWKYTHGNIVYITDETSTKEVTCYVEAIAIPRAGVTLENVAQHNAAKERLEKDPSLCTSHTVIVVDQSGSMRRSDIADFENRSKAVWGMLALEFVAAQRVSGDATDRDVVSVVLMADTPEVIIHREPMGLILYNKFVGLHDKVKPRSHGNFIPALDAAQELLLGHVTSGCALALLFLSDGKPSDPCRWRVSERKYNTQEKTTHELTESVRTLAGIFKQQLSLVTVGFAHSEQDFSVLKAMAEAALENGAQGSFYMSKLSPEGLGSALAHSVGSLTATKLRLTTLSAEPGVPRVLRQVRKEAAGTPWSYESTTTITEDGWVIYQENVRRFEFSLEALRWHRNPWVPVDFFSHTANGIGIRVNALGEGAERLVFGLQEVDVKNGELVGPKLVAKESRYVGGEYSKIGFHDVFAKTQISANRVATKFNRRVRERLSIILPGKSFGHQIWDISFIPCSVYTFFEEGCTEKRGVLAEKLLEPSSRYTKFNGNNGYVHGVLRSAAVPAAGEERPALVGEMMDVIVEGDEEEVGSDDNSSAERHGQDVTARIEGAETNAHDFSREACRQGARSTADETGSPELTSFSPEEECFVQAFSHFSYRHSGRKMLVCDLQGVLTNCPNDDDRVGVFELTDPVIHYRSESGRRQVYGRTDLGKRGIQAFFATHHCNDVCRLLGISR